MMVFTWIPLTFYTVCYHLSHTGTGTEKVQCEESTV